MKSLNYIFLFLLIIIYSIRLRAEIIVIHDADALEIINQFRKSNATYYIDNTLDLKDDTLYVKNNCILKFSENGKICNGVVIGANTIINASKHLIFKNITLKGTWNNTSVYSQWIELIESGESNNKQFKNLMILCHGTELTHLYTQDGVYYLSAINNSAPIIVPSNTYWHNKSIIRLKKCNYQKYSLVFLNKIENVIIDGGEFIGDLLDHQGAEGEWGHGIKCGGSKNIIIKNLTCRNFWGDGIDLIEGLDANGQATIICDNVTIDNVKCLYNRRQGLSIEAAQNVRISKCEFSYTGYYKKTDPSAGIDIEPWNNYGKKLFNITIDNCIMSKNKGPDLMVYTPKHIEVNYLRQDFINLLVKNCRIGFVFLHRVMGINVEHCDIKDVIRIDYSDYIKIAPTTIVKRQILNENGHNILIGK